MKVTVASFLTVAAITLGVVCIVQSRKTAHQQDQLAAAQDELGEKTKAIEALQTAQQRSKQHRRQLTAQADELTSQVHALQAAQRNAASMAATESPPVSEAENPHDEKTSGLGNILSKMMQDPESRQLVRATQCIMVEQLYAPLIGKLRLNPDEATKFKDLLADNMMNAADRASSMLSGPAAQRVEMASALSDTQNAFDEQIKVLLGDDRYALYKDYQQTAGQRMQVNAFKQQASSESNLTDEQTEALIGIMNEEQKNVAASTGLPLGSAAPDAAKFQAFLAEDKTPELLQAQETVGERVFERARTILTPNQLDAFGRFQTNQIQMMHLSMNMVRKMFAPETRATAIAPPNP